MKAKITNSLLATAIVGAMFNTNIAVANDGCDESYGPWCNVANFLEQQEPTAAGSPSLSTPFSIQQNRINTNEFGGQVESTESEFVGYALLTSVSNNGSDEPQLAKIFLDLNSSDENFTGKAVFENGQEIALTIGENANFDQFTNYAPGMNTYVGFGTESQLISDRNSSSYDGRRDINYIHTHQGVDGDTINTINANTGFDNFSDEEIYFDYEYGGSYLSLTNVAGQSYSRETNETNGDITHSYTYFIDGDEPQYGYLSWYDYSQENINNINSKYNYTSLYGPLGKPTPVDAMRQLSGTFNYEIAGSYTISKFSKGSSSFFNSSVEVNFGNSSWKTNSPIANTVNASGSVSGNTFSANSITSSIENTTVGSGSYINGNFTGTQAQQIVGQGNINLNDGNTTTNIKTVFGGTRLGDSSRRGPG